MFAHEKPPIILHVEDDQIEVRTLQRQFRKMGISNELVNAKDGIDALAYLRKTNGTGQPLQPVLVLLDLNMPRMGGIEFLHELRRDESLKGVYVFVLTTSDNPSDRANVSRYGAAGYVVKSDPEKSFDAAMQLVTHFFRKELLAPVD